MQTLNETSELSIASIDEDGTTVFAITQLIENRLQIVINGDVITHEELDELFNIIKEALPATSNKNNDKE